MPGKLQSISRKKLSIFLRPASSTDAQMDQMRLKTNQSSTMTPRCSVSETFICKIINNIDEVGCLAGVSEQLWRCELKSHPAFSCGQRVVEAAEGHYAIELSDGDQLLAAALLKADDLLNVLVKH